MRIRSAALLFAVGLFMSGDGVASPTAQSDLRIGSIRAAMTESGFDCAVEVSSSHGDRAQGTTLQILLPVGVRVALMPAGCSASPAADDGTVGFVSCRLGSVRVGASVSRTIVTTVPPEGVRRSCAALAWSLTPDPNLANNQAVKTAP